MWRQLRYLNFSIAFFIISLTIDANMYKESLKKEENSKFYTFEKSK